MKITQAYEILNGVLAETLGSAAITVDDTSDIVDIGDQIINANATDKYVQTLVNHIGRVVFVNREYRGSAPKIMMDGWEYGSIMQKIDMDLPESEKNDTWDLQDGVEYNQDIFSSPNVVQKFFNSKVTYEVKMSFTDRQVKMSFSNRQQLVAFFSMIENKIQMRLTIDYDNLIRLTIANFIGATIYSHFQTNPVSGATAIRARNLLFEYNTKRAGQAGFVNLTAANCLENLDFLKFAAKEIALCSDRMATASTMFNMGQRVRFTPKDKQHVVMLSEFAKSADVYLQSDTFHNELTKLPEAERVPFWQGSGITYAFDDTSKVNVKVVNPITPADAKVEVETSGILCCIFDRDAAAVCNVDSRVTTHRNARAEFTNNWYKSDAQYLNDYNENFVVFFVA